MNSILSRVWRNLICPAFSLLPKDQRKVVCESYTGRGFSDSPKAVAEELSRRGWKVYWLVKGSKEAESLPDGIKPLTIGSTAAIYHMCTAGVWVDNCRKWGRLYKRPSQRYVQTWHGFPLKRIEGDAESALDEKYVRAAKKDSEMSDLFVSNSAFLTEIYRRAFWYGGEVLECGFPRNDMLFGPAGPSLEKVRRELHIPPGKNLLLYAPTFRRDLGLSVYDMDYRRVCAALSERFGGDWLILAKLHPNVADRAGELSLGPEYVVNASGYADIQELYLACGALITDYSSVMFDYMNTGRPCFLYVNDLAAYKNDRNFYFDLDALPFARAENNDGLEEIILGFDEEAQRERTERFCKDLGIREDGTAARQVADWLER